MVEGMRRDQGESCIWVTYNRLWNGYTGYAYSLSPLALCYLFRD